MVTKLRKNERQNTLAVNAVFELRFEVLWIPPYDMRRSEPAFCEFERWASRTAVLLRTADSGADMPEARIALQQAVEGLRGSISWLREAHIFPPEVCDEAETYVSRLAVEFGLEL